MTAALPAFTPRAPRQSPRTAISDDHVTPQRAERCTHSALHAPSESVWTKLHESGEIIEEQTTSDGGGGFVENTLNDLHEPLEAEGFAKLKGDFRSQIDFVTRIPFTQRDAHEAPLTSDACSIFTRSNVVSQSQCKQSPPLSALPPNRPRPRTQMEERGHVEMDANLHPLSTASRP